MAKPVIKYKSFMGVDPRTDQPMLRVMICDRVVRHTEEMADALIKGGYAIGIQKSLLVGIINALADYFVDALNEGQTLLIDNRLSIRLDLVGKPNEDGSLGSRNEVKVNAIPLIETKKVTKDSFSWQRVNDDGKNPKIEFLISDSAGAARGKLIEGAAILANGRNLGITADDTVSYKFTWKEGESAQEETILPSIVSDDLIKIAWPTVFGDVPKGTEVTFTMDITTPDGLTKTTSAKATLA